MFVLAVIANIITLVAVAYLVIRWESTPTSRKRQNSRFSSQFPSLRRNSHPPFAKGGRGDFFLTTQTKTRCPFCAKLGAKRRDENKTKVISETPTSP